MSATPSSGAEQRETWLFKNERKLMFLTLTEDGDRGIVLEPGAAEPLRVATDEDKLTVQYTEAQRVMGGGAVSGRYSLSALRAPVEGKGNE